MDTAAIDTGSPLTDNDGDGFSVADGDCDDNDDNAYPGNSEVCDGVDNDCNDLIDDDASDASTWYTDQDGDSYGLEGTAEQACDAPENSATRTGDCDDNNASVNPGTSETWYDGVDNNCDGNDSDQDLDGFDAEEVGGDDCDDTDDTVNPDAEDGAGETAEDYPERSAEGAPLVDDDCDGYVDEDAVSTGDLIVTEINNYASAGGSNADSRNSNANWFEVYNASPITLMLSNWTFAACDYAAPAGVGFDSGEPDWSYCDDVEWFAVSPDAGLILLPTGYAVICRDDSVFDDPSDCDYTYGGSGGAGKNPADIPYRNASAEFRPANGMLGTALSESKPSLNQLNDDVGWYYHSSSERWPYERNMSMCLSNTALSTTENDTLENWGNPSSDDVWATAPTDNYGTPGSANLHCE